MTPTPTPQAPSEDEAKPYVKKITPGGLIYISYTGPIHDEPEPEASPDPYEPVAPPSTTPSAEAQEAAEQEAILASMTEAAIETGSYVQRAIDVALASSAAEIAELRAEADRLREALENLVNKISTIHEHSKYQAVWTVAQMHLGQYDGPQYVDELFEAREVLKVGQP